MSNLLTDILKTKDFEKGNDTVRYSFSRVTLFILLIMMMIYLIALSINIDINDHQFTVDMIYKLIMLFSAYAFGSKAVQHYSAVNTNKTMRNTHREKI